MNDKKYDELACNETPERTLFKQLMKVIGLFGSRKSLELILLYQFNIHLYH